MSALLAAAANVGSQSSCETMLARLAALVPPPPMHQTRYHELGATADVGVWDRDRGLCRRGGRLRIGASIEEPQVIARILAHVERVAPEQCSAGWPLGARAPPSRSRRL
jgi:hypothetical protein